MTENKYQWHVLLRKYVDGVINEIERVELYRQMGKDQVKLDLVDRVTESDFYRNRLLRLLSTNEEEDLKRFEAMLKEHYGK